MRRRLVILLGFALVLFALAPAVMARHGGGNGAHVAHLSGSEEVPEPQVPTDAQGQAIFKFSGDESALHYKLIVANIDNVVAAHIHCGVVGVAGPVGVTLFTGFESSPNGILATATVTETDVNFPTEDPVDNACGWDTIADVAAAIEADNAYVNVHTVANPPGEIRGQIR